MKRVRSCLLPPFSCSQLLLFLEDPPAPEVALAHKYDSEDCILYVEYGRYDETSLKVGSGGAKRCLAGTTFFRETADA